MKRMKKRFTIQWAHLLTSVFLLQGISIAVAQNIVTGEVKDEEGMGLPGVAIAIEGTNKGTITDADGKYSINVAGDGRLTYTFIGYEKQTVTVNNRSVIDVTMKPDVTALQEVVVIGYGTQEKRDVTGAISSVDQSDGVVTGQSSRRSDRDGRRRARRRCTDQDQGHIHFQWRSRSAVRNRWSAGR